MRTWRLDEWEERAKKDERLKLVPAVERWSLKAGWFVKLRFVPIHSLKHDFDEQLWVRVAKVKNDGAAYVGVLEQKPAEVEGLELGEVIDFEPKHVLDYLDRKIKP